MSKRHRAPPKRLSDEPDKVVCKVKKLRRDADDDADADAGGRRNRPEGGLRRTTRPSPAKLPSGRVTPPLTHVEPSGCAATTRPL